LSSTKLRDLESVEIISAVLQANLLAKKNNNINNESSNLFNKAEKLAKKLNNKTLMQWVFTQQGYYYFTYRDYIKAWPFFLQSSRLLNNSSNILILQPEDTYTKNAAFFTLIQDYKKSIRFLEIGIEDSTNDLSKLLHELGYTYFKKGSVDSSFMFYNKAKVAALKEENNKQYTKTLLNIAVLQVTNTNWQAAEKTFLQVIEISQLHNYTEYLFKAHLELGKIYSSLNVLDKAKNHLSIAQELRKVNSSINIHDLGLAESLLSITSLQNNLKDEFSFLQDINYLKNITKANDDYEIIKSIAIENEKEKISTVLQSKNTLLERESLKKWILLTVSVILTIFLTTIIYYNNRKLKMLQKHFDTRLDVYKANKVKSDSKIKELQKLLKSITDKLDEKNSQIFDLQKEIKKLTKRNLPNKLEKKVEFEELLSSHLMTNENWLQFKNIFIEEESMYFNELISKYPDLTESNLRIIILTKIGLNNQEIAKVLGITLDAVKKSKQRLRQKYDHGIIPF